MKKGEKYEFFMQNANISQKYISNGQRPELLFQIPSVDTFRRKIKKIPFAVLEYAHKGEKTMHNHCVPQQRIRTDSMGSIRT